MTKELCDLHTHSYYSDGTTSPAFIIDEAERIGLTAVALCDHNTAAGLPEFLQYAKKSPVEAIAGVEFSTSYREKELHVLALFVKEQHFEKINELSEILHKRKEESNQRLVAALSAAGYKIDYEKIKRESKGGINRAHIATALLEGGYAESVKAAFCDILDESRGYYIPPERFDVFEIIDFICEIGATPVLAHPLLNLSADELREFLFEAIPHGLKGMEVIYSGYSTEETEIAKKIATECGILSSGGSDFHGERKPDISLGTGKGNLEIPASFIYALRLDN